MRYKVSFFLMEESKHIFSKNWVIYHFSEEIKIKILKTVMYNHVLNELMLVINMLSE